MEVCPDGYHVNEAYPNGSNDGTTRRQCEACHEACTQCEENLQSNWVYPAGDPAPGYKRCCGNTCQPGYYRKDTGLEKIECLQECGADYYGDEDTRRCIEKWTVIAYQDSALSESNFTVKVNDFNLEADSNERGVTEPLQNFFNLNVLSLEDGAGNNKMTTLNEADPPVEVWKVY